MGFSRGLVRRHPVLTVTGLLALVAVALGLLALPLRSVPANAEAAKSELVAAVEALGTSDSEVAFEHVATARAKVDQVTDVTEGIGARIWSWIPFAGGGVSDVRDLASAMDHLTTALEETERVHPQLSGDDSRLLSDGSFDLEVLDEVRAALGRVTSHVTLAQEHLDAVDGTFPVVGARVAEARDEARAEVGPVATGLRRLSPLLEELPSLLGGEGEKKYVVAMLNPSEMKYSGGSMLTFSVLTLDGGKIQRGKTLDVVNAPKLFRRGFWENVEGNPFASTYSERITHASIAPSWPVAGEETLRAWEWLRKSEVDGLMAVDVVALSRILKVTGPVYVQGLGQVRHDNLVELTAGDYDKFGPAQQAQRKELNRKLIPAFIDRLFSGSDLVATVRAIGEASRERHMAMYMRDARVQAAVAEYGLDGDLSDTDHDYLGFFTQNLVGSKADFWQQKEISSEVALAADGSARVTLSATMENTSSGLTGQLSAYTDPDINANLALFLPRDVQVEKVSISDSDGRRAGSEQLGDYFGRPYLVEPSKVLAGDRATLEVVYTVPRAATVQGDRLTYLLDLDPHPTVTDARTEVTVTLPDGFRAAPDTTLDSDEQGWSAVSGGAWRWSSPAMATRESLTLSARKS